MSINRSLENDKKFFLMTDLGLCLWLMPSKLRLRSHTPRQKTTDYF